MEKRTIKKRICAGITSMLLAAVLVFTAWPAGVSYAASNENGALREVHKIGVGKKAYCFFVTHNVVMTPEEISKIEDDDALVAEVLKRSGLYMKEANCTTASHKAITPKDWAKKGGSLGLCNDELKKSQEPVDPEPSGGGTDSSGDASSGDDTGGNTDGSADSGETVEVNEVVKALREAAPTEGYPVRISADVTIKTDAKDEKAKVYSTHKDNSPDLIFIAVATAEDAKTYGEEICEKETEKEKKTPKKKKVMPSPKPNGGEKEEMLPELRTINMSDRSGGPLEPTLKEGDPVTLEWKEPGKQTDTDIDQKGFFDHAWAIPVLGAAALAIALAAILLIRRRREEEE